MSSPIPKALAEELRRIAARHGVDRVRVFGSHARGEALPGSDLDLLVRLLPGHGFSDFMAFCEEAESRPGPASGCCHRRRLEPLHPRSGAR